ncbi:MAG: class I SAM-dependent methyltransferase [Actinobacteria bacterium]|nr:class I SAM-dependent methyltransferase [Actinomycetota bacterium]MCB9411586.1 class I SAM-dependent methyltransferase [Actinomycetota bacterium]
MASIESAYRIASEGLLAMRYGGDFLVTTRAGRCEAISASAYAALVATDSEGCDLAGIAVMIAAEADSRNDFVVGMESFRRLAEIGAVVQVPAQLPRGDDPIGPTSVQPHTSGPSLLETVDIPLSWSAMAADSVTVAGLVDEVLSSPGRRLLEFGPGLSTAAVRLAAEFASRSVDIVGIEQDAQWAAAIREALPDSALGSITLIVAPLVPAEAGASPFPLKRWYHRDSLTQLQGPFDVLLVDGPTAFREDWRFDRWPALEFARPLLAPDATVVLDDIGRGGERAIAREWQARLGDEWDAQTVGRSMWLSHRRRTTG